MFDTGAVILPVLPFPQHPKWFGRGLRFANSFDFPEGIKKVKIIVIDDEPVIAETVAEILKDEGFEAVFVSSGDAAIELTKTIQPDIVLSDVIMPGINGIDTAMQIRALAPGCKIILFSGQAATVDLLDAAHAQGHDFQILAKPIKPELLLSVIRDAMSSGKT
jgi:CheY-like chemotaxis protein